MALFLSLLIATSALATKSNPADELARRQRLQQSANAWFEREAAPAILRGGLRAIDSYGVRVKEKPVVLPPDLGGPLPNRPVTVQVEVSLTGASYEHGRGSVRTECRFAQPLLANANRQGKPESIRPGQGFRALLACASGYRPNPRDYGREAW